MGRGKPSKADFEKSREKELSQKNRELQREIRVLKNEIERLKKQGDRPRKSEPEMANEDLSLDMCSECGKGSLSTVSFYKVDKRFTFQQCSLCGYRTKSIEAKD